ncbi:acyl-CoA dehydrogenase family protein [Paremcibacter congregatus]|uniref:acyl-CoA dehydrogenase family protein n=1 Tax=Paremcibacter congregatus TaxID=2043170 RepID=UPI0030EC0ED4
MKAYRPRSNLTTHEVHNQPEPLCDYNLYLTDQPVQDAFTRFGKASAGARLTAFGALLGSDDILAQGDLANKYPPKLKSFDQFGNRIDEVEFHPAYHKMMQIGSNAGISSIAWRDDEADQGHVTHAALEYLQYQVEGGTCCPLTMTYASVAALRHQPDILSQWLPGILSCEYDPRSLPADQKTGLTIGMAMTEKQGGSDVRSNSTTATAIGDNMYELLGHKWFCSAPMCDAFLTLANTDQGLSCFLVPRWREDGDRNSLQIMRLKDKLGNKSNASSEIEYHHAQARMVGVEGRGVATIIDMVHHTRLDCCLAPIALMRQALSQAVHHCRQRTAFQKKLIDQPVMQAVLADLAVEVEAGVLTFMHIARKFDDSAENSDAKTYARLAVAVAKYWHNKRCPNFVYEAMECLGGAGYVEESILPRLYREAPLNSIWEGAGNVICLDILRTLQKEPRALELYFAELTPARGTNKHLDRAVSRLKDLLKSGDNHEPQARRLVEQMALCLQGALVVQFAPAPVSDLFCATRLGQDWGHAYGTIPPRHAVDQVLSRVWQD